MLTEGNRVRIVSANEPPEYGILESIGLYGCVVVLDQEFRKDLDDTGVREVPFDKMRELTREELELNLTNERARLVRCMNRCIQLRETLHKRDTLLETLCAIVGTKTVEQLEPVLRDCYQMTTKILEIIKREEVRVMGHDERKPENEVTKDAEAGGAKDAAPGRPGSPDADAAETTTRTETVTRTGDAARDTTGADDKA